MKTLLLFFLALFLMSTAVHGATFESVEAAKKFTDQVIATVAAGEFEAGMRMMKPYLIVPEAEFDMSMEKMKLQLPAIQRRFGKTIGSEYISQKAIGKSLMRITYIQKFEKHVLQWQFIFYKPEAVWLLDTFNTDDKIQSLFDE